MGRSSGVILSRFDFLTAHHSLLVDAAILQFLTRSEIYLGRHGRDGHATKIRLGD